MFSVVNKFEKVVVDPQQIDYLYLICITKSINNDLKIIGNSISYLLSDG